MMIMMSRRLVTSEADRRGGVADGKHPWTSLDEDPFLWCGWLQDPDFARLAGYTAKYTECTP